VLVRRVVQRVQNSHRALLVLVLGRIGTTSALRVG
jgi:hypothetical protein